MRDLQLKRFFLMLFGTIWSVSAWAAQTTFVGDLADIPPAAVAVSVLLAIIGGAAFTAQKMADPTVVVKSVVLEIIKDTLNSVVAGILTFFVLSWAGWPAVLQAAGITIAGYGGSRVLEGYLNAGLSRILRLGAKPESTP
jgi:hypothetical protein